MKFSRMFIFVLFCLPMFMLSLMIPVSDFDKKIDQEFIDRIKKEYGIIIDNLFAQGQEQLETKADIVAWLYRKNKEEFVAIQNLMTDVKVELDFDCNNENIVKKELQENLKAKIQDEADKVFAMDGITAENMQDFFHISRMVCNVTLGSDDSCRKMIRSFRKGYCSDIKKLKIIDKAAMKIKKEEKKQQKKELLVQLREQIILGSCPRK